VVRSLWLFNILLVILSLGLAIALIGSMMDRSHLDLVPRPNAGARQSSPGISSEQGTALRLTSRRPLSSFDTVLKRNPFRSPQKPPQPKRKVSRPARKVPIATLQGTVFVGKERKAILTEGRRQEIYSLGDSVSGGTLTKIEAGRVVIERGDHLAEVFLKNSVRMGRPPVNASIQGEKVLPSKTISLSAEHSPKKPLGKRVPKKEARK
jgi:type II secretory pathway component PulC